MPANQKQVQKSLDELLEWIRSEQSPLDWVHQRRLLIDLSDQQKADVLQRWPQLLDEEFFKNLIGLLKKTEALRLATDQYNLTQQYLDGLAPLNQKEVFTQLTLGFLLLQLWPSEKLRVLRSDFLLKFQTAGCVYVQKCEQAMLDKSTLRCQLLDDFARVATSLYTYYQEVCKICDEHLAGKRSQPFFKGVEDRILLLLFNCSGWLEGTIKIRYWKNTYANAFEETSKHLDALAGNHLLQREHNRIKAKARGHITFEQSIQEYRQKLVPPSRTSTALKALSQLKPGAYQIGNLGVLSLNHDHAFSPVEDDQKTHDYNDYPREVFSVLRNHLSRYTTSLNEKGMPLVAQRPAFAPTVIMGTKLDIIIGFLSADHVYHEEFEQYENTNLNEFLHQSKYGSIPSLHYILECIYSLLLEPDNINEELIKKLKNALDSFKRRFLEKEKEWPSLLNQSALDYFQGSLNYYHRQIIAKRVSPLQQKQAANPVQRPLSPEETASLRMMAQEQKSTAKEWEQKIGVHTDECSRLEALIKSKDEALNAEQPDIKTLSKTLKAQRKELTSLNADKNELQRKHDETNKSLTDTETALQKIAHDSQSLQEQQLDWVAKLSELTKAFGELTIHHKTLKEKNAEAETRAQDIRANYAPALAELEAYQAQQKQLKIAVSEASIIRKGLNDSQTAITEQAKKTAEQVQLTLKQLEGLKASIKKNNNILSAQQREQATLDQKATLDFQEIAQITKKIENLTLKSKQLKHEQESSLVRHATSSAKSKFPQSLLPGNTVQSVYRKLAEDEASLKLKVKLITPKDLKAIKDKVKSLMAYLEQESSHRVFIHGGFIRCLLSGKPYHDIDLVTTLPTSWMMNHLETLKNLGFHFRPIEKFPGLFKDDFNKLDLLCNPNLDMDTELEQCDFTFNALMLNAQFELIDLTGHSFEDVKNHRVELLGSLKRLQSDPSLLLRMIRITLEHEWHVDESSYPILRAHIHLVNRIPFAIFHINLESMFKPEIALPCLDFLHTAGLIQGLFDLPEQPSDEFMIFCRETLESAIHHQTPCSIPALFTSYAYFLKQPFLNASDITRLYFDRWRQEWLSNQPRPGDLERMVNQVEAYGQAFMRRVQHDASSQRRGPILTR